MNLRKILRWSLVGLLLVNPACSMAATVSYYLDQSNISSLPDGTNYLQVTISDGAAGAIDFRVETLAALNAIAANKFGMDQFGFNTSRLITSSNISGLPGAWSYGGAGNMDGFGGFTVRPDTSGANNRIPVLTFSIVGISGDVITDYIMPSSGNAGQGNQFFAAHVAGFNDGYGNSSAFFGGSTPVPVPAAIWLFGSGLLGLVGLARRKK